MKFTNMTKENEQLINKAIAYAFEAHEGQLDDSGQLYMKHPLQVLEILRKVTGDVNLLAAAVLHDTLEDTDTTYNDLVIEFGPDIADLVNEVTHAGSKEMSGYYFPRLKTQRGIMLKFADRLSNLSRMEVWDQKRKDQYLQKSKFWAKEPGERWER